MRGVTVMVTGPVARVREPRLVQQGLLGLAQRLGAAGPVLERAVERAYQLARRRVADVPQAHYLGLRATRPVANIALEGHAC